MKSVSVWIGYLMYITFAISILSIVLFTVSSYIEQNKTKLTVKSLIDIILFLDKKIREINSCYECFEKIEIKLPEDTILYLSNGLIYSIFYSNYLYNVTPSFVNISIEENNGIYKYNISKNSINFIANLNFTREACLIINKTEDSLKISFC